MHGQPRHIQTLSESVTAQARFQTRRHFLRTCQLGLGSIALSALSGEPSVCSAVDTSLNPLASKPSQFRATAKNVIYLHMGGGPPQHELFDWKPELVKHHLKPCPESLLAGQRFAFIKGTPTLLGTPYKFAQHGRSGAWISELLPNLATAVDEMAIVKSMITEQVNHAPAEMFMLTGSARPGSGSLGSWITYGLGCESEDLPAYVVLLSGPNLPGGGKSLWSNGYLPPVHQGVQCRAQGDPILYISNPPGVDRAARRSSLDALRRLNELELAEFGDRETLARIAQYELAYRMQTAVPEVMDIAREPENVRQLYGAQPGAASFANNCLQARRLVERGVRFVQLFDWGWDTHGSSATDDIIGHLPKKCKEIDQAIMALLKDLKVRGMLDETLVIWGGEFGRTSMNEGRDGSKFLGRDHHPHAFTMWLAGGGVKPGIVYGATDDLGYHVTRDKMTVPDLQATILHLMGLDAHKLTYRYQGLNQRLIGPVDTPRVHHEIVA